MGFKDKAKGGKLKMIRLEDLQQERAALVSARESLNKDITLVEDMIALVQRRQSTHVVNTPIAVQAHKAVSLANKPQGLKVQKILDYARSQKKTVHYLDVAKAVGAEDSFTWQTLRKYGRKVSPGRFFVRSVITSPNPNPNPKPNKE